MAVVLGDLYTMMQEVGSRHERIVRLLSGELGLQFEYPPSQYWYDQHCAEMQSVFVRFSETRDERLFRKQLRCIALNDCAYDCLNLISWQRCQEVVGSNLERGERELQQVLAGMPASETTELFELSKQLRSSNPLKMGRRDLNHWLARQDEVLFDAGFSRGDLRRLRGEKGPVARRGTALAKRVSQRTGTRVTDSILPNSSRIMRKQISALSRAPGGPRFGQIRSKSE